VACSGGTPTLPLPDGVDAETLIVHTAMAGAAPGAEAFERPFVPSLDVDETKDVVVRLLYFRGRPDAVGVRPGALVLTDASDEVALELVPDSAYEASVTDGEATAFAPFSADPIHVAPARPGRLRFSVRQWGMAELLGGIEACIDGAPAAACKRSNTTGGITLGGIEPGAVHVVRLRGAEIADTAFMVQTTSEMAELGSSIFAMPREMPANVASNFGTTLDTTMGVIDVVAHTGPLNFDPQPVNVVLSPSSGESFRSTTGNLVFNVLPGEYSVSISADDKEYCGPSGLGENWLGRDRSEVRLRVFAGTVTHVQNIVCQ
jgi:hypothetical protein